MTGRAQVGSAALSMLHATFLRPPTLGSCVHMPLLPLPLIRQVVLRMMEEVSNEDYIRMWAKKLAPPLVTLLSAEPEVQYVALRNINLIVQRWPQILSHEVKVSGRSSEGLLREGCRGAASPRADGASGAQGHAFTSLVRRAGSPAGVQQQCQWLSTCTQCVAPMPTAALAMLFCRHCRAQVFFCKYNDPIYVKMEKLEIMIKLANDKNIDQVLLEFKEYAQEVDVDFVRKVGGRDVLAFCSRRWVAGDCTALCERRASLFAGRSASQHRQVHALCLLAHMCTVSVLWSAGCARHWPLCCEPGERRAALHRSAAGVDPDQGQLRGAGGCHRHQSATHGTQPAARVL